MKENWTSPGLQIPGLRRCGLQIHNDDGISIFRFISVVFLKSPSPYNITIVIVNNNSLFLYLTLNVCCKKKP